MTDAAVYMVANLSVKDVDEYRKYEKGFFPILKRHGGEFITYDDSSITLEGEARIPGRIVLFRFPSEKHAKDWFDDPEYQAISQHRRAGTTTHFLTLIHGLPPRPAK
jgi:uncharacterized protein (DUF1330 family)